MYELLSALGKVAELDDGDESGDDDAGVADERGADNEDDDMQKAKFEAAKKAAVEASRAAILGGGGPSGQSAADAIWASMPFGNEAGGGPHGGLAYDDESEEEL